MLREIVNNFGAGSSVIDGMKQNISGLGLDTPTDLWAVVKNVINIAMTLLAAICVVMLIFAGYNYTTSAGDSGKVTKAKNTMLYAVIGLIIALLALAIVNFVLNNIIGTSASKGNG